MTTINAKIGVNKAPPPPGIAKLKLLCVQDYDKRPKVRKSLPKMAIKTKVSKNAKMAKNGHKQPKRGGALPPSSPSNDQSPLVGDELVCSLDRRGGVPVVGNRRGVT